MLMVSYMYMYMCISAKKKTADVNFSCEEERKFQTRYESGYDLPDERFKINTMPSERSVQVTWYARLVDRTVMGFGTLQPSNHSARNYGKSDGRRTVLNSPSLDCKQFSNVSSLVLRLLVPDQAPDPCPMLS